VICKNTPLFGPPLYACPVECWKRGPKPNSGVFLQITCDEAEDLPVPGHSYTFGIVTAAQARGDFEVLAERGRRALRAHITGDLKNGLDTLSVLLKKPCGRRLNHERSGRGQKQPSADADAGPPGAAMHLGDFRRGR